MLPEVAVVGYAIFKATRSERPLNLGSTAAGCWRRRGGAAAPTAHHPSRLQAELVAGGPSPSGTSRQPFDPGCYSPACTTPPSASTGIDHGFQKHMYSLLAYSGPACYPPYRPACSTPPDFRIFRLETILETSPDPPVCPAESCTRRRLATPARK